MDARILSRHVTRTVVRGRYLLILIVGGLMAAVMVRTAGRAPSNDWLEFESAARFLVHYHHLSAYNGHALSLYSVLPAIQIGPPAVLPVAALQWLSPYTVSRIFVGLMVLLCLAAVASVERAARTAREAGFDQTSANVALIGGCIVMVDWTWCIVHWRHLDDAMALTLTAIAGYLIATRRPWWLIGLLIGTAVAAKPWAVVLTPVLMGLPREARSKAILGTLAVAGAWWTPFVIGSSGTIGALGGYHIGVDHGSVLWLVGITGDVQRWLRPVQFIGGISAGVLIARVGGRWWLAAPLAGIAVRVLTDPFTWGYYGMGPILFALLWDLTRPTNRRLPTYTVLTALVEGLLPRLTSFPLSGPATGSAYLVAGTKLLWGVGVLVALFVEVHRSRGVVVALASGETSERSLGRRVLDWRTAAGCWLALRLVGVILLAGTLYPYVKGDVTYLYAIWANALHHGLLPWRHNFFIEYPPGVLVFLALPGASVTYEVEFVVLALLADAVIAVALWRKRPSGLGFWLWALVPVFLGPVMWVRFDIFVAAALVGFVLFLERARWRLAGLCVAAATLLKLWPLVLVAVVWPLVGAKHARRVMAWAIGGVLALTVPVLAWGGASGLVKMLRYQGERGIESESLWAYPSQLVHRSPTALAPAHGSLELAVSGVWAVVGSLLLPLAVAVVLGCCWWDRGRRLSIRSACLLAVSVVLVASKVLSPQYIVWVVAVVTLVLDADDGWSRKERRLLFGATALLAVTTQWLYPITLFQSWPHVETSALVALSAHAFGALAWFVVAIRYVVRCPTKDDSPYAVQDVCARMV